MLGHGFDSHEMTSLQGCFAVDSTRVANILKLYFCSTCFSQLVVNWWFGLVVWISGIPLWKGLLLGLKSQTSNPNHQFTICWFSTCTTSWHKTFGIVFIFDPLAFHFQQDDGEEIRKYQPDVLGLCEVDHFEEMEKNLAQDGYDGTYKRKRHSQRELFSLFHRMSWGSMSMGDLFGHYQFEFHVFWDVFTTLQQHVGSKSNSLLQMLRRWYQYEAFFSYVQAKTYIWWLIVYLIIKIFHASCCRDFPYYINNIHTYMFYIGITL